MLTIEPCDLLAPHDPRGLLDQKERRAHVDVENLVVAFLGGVEDVAAIGQRGGVDERVDAAEALDPPRRSPCGNRRPCARSAVTKTVGQPVARDFLGDPFALGRVAAADHQSGRAAFGEQPRDGLAEALRAAGDDGDLAVQIRRPSIGWARAGLGAGVFAMGVLLGRTPRRRTRCVRTRESRSLGR